MADLQGVPPIVRGRFGLEQRCAYKHPDLYDEEVPEIDLETAIARPELGAGCAVRSFLLLGDQNAGKSTMLHSFCRYGDAGFMQLSSLLPILASSFLNTRMVPQSWMGQEDPDQVTSVVRDEIPYMDTDIARGLVMLSLENFAFFAQEFGLWDPSRPEEAPAFMNFDSEVRFVTLQFTELGGDHLDRLLRFVHGDLETVRAAEPSIAETGADEAFWNDMHEVLSASVKLLKETSRTAYFINCAVLFPGGHLSAAAWRQTLFKLRFLDEVLGGSHGGEVLFYCSRAASVDMSVFDVARSWADALREAAAFAKEVCGREFDGAQEVYQEADDEALQQQEPGLDVSALAEVAGAAASAAWTDAEARAVPLLRLLRQLLRRLTSGLRLGLRIVAVQLVRNYADEDGGRSRTLCPGSVVRNVATLLQRCSTAAAEGPDSLIPQVADLILRCASTVRRVEGHMVHGCWVTRSDLAEHLEECEAEQSAVPLPEAAVLSAWPKAAGALLSAGLVCAPAQGLPQVTLELCRTGPVLRLGLREDVRSKPSSDVLFVTGASQADVVQAPDAVALPFDAELFALLTSEAALRSVAGRLASLGGAAFRFESPAIVRQLQGIQTRLRQEMEELLSRILSRPPPGQGLLARLIRCASDLWQAECLEPPGADEPTGNPLKRLRMQISMEEREASERLRALATEEGLDVMIDLRCDAGSEERSVSLQLP